jgi:hypothetical protein
MEKLNLLDGNEYTQRAVLASSRIKLFEKRSVIWTRNVAYYNTSRSHTFVVKDKQLIPYTA